MTNTAMTLNRFGQILYGLETVVLRGKRRAAGNRGTALKSKHYFSNL